jgi:hypothetical protein
MFGADGLTKDPKDYVDNNHSLWNYLAQIPEDLTKEFWAERYVNLHTWARQNQDELRAVKKRTYCIECGNACKQNYQIRADLWERVYGKDYPIVHVDCLQKRVLEVTGTGLAFTDFIDTGVLSFVHRLGIKDAQPI